MPSTGLHVDELESSRLAGHQLRRAGDLTMLTDAQVVAATGKADLEADVLAATVHADERDNAFQVNKGIDLAAALGVTDTVIQNATSLENLISNTEADGDGRRGPQTIE